jgi:predicted acetyltransferase
VSNLVLVKPDNQHKTSFLAGFDELQSDSDRISWIYLGEAAFQDFFQINFQEYVNTLLQRETQPPPNFVRDSVYWALLENEVVGRIAIRHELNDFLEKVGGHIGYIVRPSARRKGIATEMLRQILLSPKAKSIGKLLLTCDETNIASERTIIKNGGILQDIFIFEPNKPAKKRFWLNRK